MAGAFPDRYNCRSPPGPAVPAGPPRPTVPPQPAGPAPAMRLGRSPLFPPPAARFLAPAALLLACTAAPAWGQDDYVVSGGDDATLVVPMNGAGGRLFVSDGNRFQTTDSLFTTVVDFGATGNTNPDNRLTLSAGAGSVFFLDSSATNSGSISVGVLGDDTEGVLTLAGGVAVTSQGGAGTGDSLSVGVGSSGENGTVLVTGGSSLQVLGNVDRLTIGGGANTGTAGTGALTVNDGSADFRGLTVGDRGTGTLNIDGPNSALDADELRLGIASANGVGTGTLNVTGGGTVTAGTLRVGVGAGTSNPDGSGAVSVTGSNSSLTVEALQVGDDDFSTNADSLTVADGGTVTLTGPAPAGSTPAGTVEAGGTIRVESNGDFVNETALTFSGGGTLDLAGGEFINQAAGVTVFDGGEIVGDAGTFFGDLAVATGQTLTLAPGDADAPDVGGAASPDRIGEVTLDGNVAVNGTGNLVFDAELLDGMSDVVTWSTSPATSCSDRTPRRSSTSPASPPARSTIPWRTCGGSPTSAR